MWEVEGGREWERVYRRKGCLQSVGEVGETEREKIGGGGGGGEGKRGVWVFMCCRGQSRGDITNLIFI